MRCHKRSEPVAHQRHVSVSTNCINCLQARTHVTYRVAAKSKPLSLIIIKSYLNTPLWLDFSSTSTRKWLTEYNKSVLKILCVTEFVMSSLAMYEVAIQVKSTHLIKSCMKIRKNEKICKWKFYINPHKRLFWNGMHSLLKRDDARGSANIIYRIWHISLVRESGSYWGQKVGHA